MRSTDAMQGPAEAARPGTLIATGEAPNIAVDAAGTGYVAWNDEPPGQVDEPVGLCVIAHGGSRCSSKRDVIADGESGEAQPPLIRADGHGQLTIASSRCCTGGNVEMISADGGATFTAPAAIGDLTYFDGAIGPGGQVLFVYNNPIDGVLSQIGGLGAPADATATLINPAPGLNAPTGFAGNTPVVVASGSETTAAIYSGSGDPNDGANWHTVRVPGSTFNPSVASGSHCLYLLQDTGPSQRRLTVRRFNGHGFGRAHVVVITSLTEGTALAEDATGRLVATWYRSDTMFAAASRDGGVHWTRPHVIATDVPDPGRMQAALGPDGRGWLVYEPSGADQIRLVGLNARTLLGPKPKPKKRRAGPGGSKPGSPHGSHHPPHPNPHPHPGPHPPKPGPHG
jgi:hypothetical protein